MPCSSAAEGGGSSSWPSAAPSPSSAFISASTATCNSNSLVHPPEVRPRLDSVVEMQQPQSAFHSSSSARTRLISPLAPSIDYNPLILSSAITVVLLLVSAYWLISEWWSSSSPSSTSSESASLCLLFATCFMLAVNAFLGLRVWRRLEKIEDDQFTEYITNVTSTSTHEPLLVSSKDDDIWQCTVIGHAIV